MSPAEQQTVDDAIASAEKVQATNSSNTQNTNNTNSVNSVNRSSGGGNANINMGGSTGSSIAPRSQNSGGDAALMKDNNAVLEEGNDRDRNTLKDLNAKAEMKSTCNSNQSDNKMITDLNPIQERIGRGENDGCDDVKSDKNTSVHSDAAENNGALTLNVATRTVINETACNKENEISDGGENDKKDEQTPSQQQHSSASSLPVSPAPEINHSKSENKIHTNPATVAGAQESTVPSSAEANKIPIAKENISALEILSTSEENSHANDNGPIHPDRQRAALLLAHRKMILYRLRQCRKAADERLKEYEALDKQRNLEQKKQGEGGNGDDNEGKSGASDKKKDTKVAAPLLPLKSNHQTSNPSNKQSKQQQQILQKQKDLYQQKIYDNRSDEISAYKELSSFAMSFTNRRQSLSTSLVGAAGGGSSRNISLRTGSSVGNKMKAAVATLTNNVGWVSSSSTSSENNNLSNHTATDLGGGLEQQQQQKEGGNVNLPQHTNLNIGMQQLQNQNTAHPKGANFSSGNTDATSKQQKHHHGNNGVKTDVKNLPISSKTIAANVQLPQNTIKPSNPTATTGPILPTSSSFNPSKKEIKRQSTTAIGDNVIVNGPSHHHLQQQQPQPPSSSLPQPPLPTDKQLKKKGKSRRSSSKRSLSPNDSVPASSTSTNDSSGRAVSVNLPLHHGMMSSNNNLISKNLTGISGGAWNKNATNNVHTTGQYPDHALPNHSMRALHTPSSSTMDHHAHYHNIPVITQQHFPPRSLCPETDRLRKKRRLIETKLESIFKKRYMSSVVKECTTAMKIISPGASSMRQNGLNNGMVVSSPKSSTFDPTATTSRKIKQPMQQQSSSFQQPLSSVIPNENPYIRRPSSTQNQPNPPLSWKKYMSLGGYAPCLLPQRQKTQWDTVLGEMRWLATDFIEERKWKKASARIISHSVSVYTSSMSTSPSPLRRLSSKATSSCSSTRSISSKTPSTLSSKLSSEMKNISTSDLKLVEIEREATKSSQNDDFDRTDINGNEEEEASMEGESSEVENKIATEIKYEDPSEDDLKRAKSVSKIISTVVEDHWEMMSVDSHNVPNRVSTFSKFRSMYDKLDVGYNVDKSSDLKCDMDEDTKETEVGHKKQVSHEDISSGMENSLEFSVKLHSDLPSAYEKYEEGLSQALDGIGIELHVSQIKCLQYVEALWQDNDCTKTSGLVLNGPIASGKTFSMCALFWRRRNLGPQILICPSTSLVRWRHELKRFTGLKVLTYGEVGWSFDTNSFIDASKKRCLNACDVLVCESSSVKKLCGYILSGGIQLQSATVAIDSRYELNNASSLNTQYCEEFMSSQWWSDTIEHIVKNETKTILISSTGSIDRKHASGGCRQMLESKKANEIMSFKLAFLQHHLFHSNSAFYGKRTFWWAKKRYKMLKSQTEKEKSKSVFCNSIGARGVLCRSIEILSYIHEEVDEDLPSVFPNWFVQFCPLTSDQRLAYESDCSFLRGSFAGTQNDNLNSSNKTFSTVAKALLRLRRTCFHSNLHSITVENHATRESFSSMYDIRGTETKQCPQAQSCSQPNINLAKSLLDHSSKLQQLFNILYKDCGCEVHDSSTLLTVQHKSTRKKRKRKKVLILCCLPDILRVTSLFLDAVGIAHELLLPLNSQVELSSSHSLTWTQCQQAIARFENGVDMCTSCDIVLSSPEILGSMSLGLSAANAEVVISLDEDWSGRSNLLIYSILMKNCIQADSGGGRKYIKLIAEDTCEESFLTFAKKVKGRSSVYPIPLSMCSFYNAIVDVKGYLSLNMEHAMKQGSLLGSNVLRCNNVPLSSVLCTTSVIPPLAFAGGDRLFLADSPEVSNDTSNRLSAKADGDLMNLGNKIPSLFDDEPDSFEVTRTENGKKKSIILALSLIEVEKSTSDVNKIFIATERSTSYLDQSRSLLQNISAHRDVASKEIQSYVHNLKKKVKAYGNQYEQKKVLQVPTQKSSKSSSVKSRREKRSKAKAITMEKPVTPGLKRKSIVSDTQTTASSFLVYQTTDRCRDLMSDRSSIDKGSSEHFPVEQNILKHVISTNAEERDGKKRRMNVYASSYSSLICRLDGNQGSESLVYFPPVFPHLHTRKDHETVEEMPVSTIGTASSKKRKLSTKDVQPSGKKLRAASKSLTPVGSGTTGNSMANEAPIPLPIQPKDITSDLNLITSTDDFIENTSSLFDDFLPDLSLDKVGDVIDEKVDLKPELVPIKAALDEDFGLLGSGNYPNTDHFTSGMQGHVYSNPYSFWLDPFEPFLPAVKAYSYLSDVEEASYQLHSMKGPELGSLVIRVKVRPRVPIGNGIQSVGGYPGSVTSSFVRHMNIPPNKKPTLPTNMRFHQTSNGGPGSLSVGHQMGQKKKKKSERKNSLSPTMSYPKPQPEIPMAVNSFGVVNPSSNAPINSYPALPTRNIAMKDRQQFGASSLTHSPVRFEKPFVLLRHNLFNLIDSVAKHRKGVSNDPRPLSIKLLAENEHTGDLARQCAKFQQDNFVVSSQIGQVNFVPFSIAFSVGNGRIPLCSSSPRVGIKLPMGVKVQHRHRNFAGPAQSDGKWSEFDDSTLRALVEVYGCNWHVACQALSWNSGDAMLGLNTVRSASQCNERWKMLNQKDGGTYNSDKVCNNGSTTRGKVGKKLEVTDIPSSLSVLVQSSEMVDNKCCSLPKEPATRRFSRLRKASSKRHIIPLTVPGYNSGSTNAGIQTHPSHPSHLQSVKNAVAVAAGSSGLPPAKLEMWPLQFLDVAEKQRQNIAKRHHGNGNQPPQQHAHAMRQTSVPNHQASMTQQQQQTIRPTSRTATLPTSHSNVVRNQEPVPPPSQQLPASSTYSHPMHPNSSSRMGTSRR